MSRIDQWIRREQSRHGRGSGLKGGWKRWSGCNIGHIMSRIILVRRDINRKWVYMDEVPFKIGAVVGGRVKYGRCSRKTTCWETYNFLAIGS